MWWNQNPIRFGREVDQLRNSYPEVRIVRGQVPRKFCLACSGNGKTSVPHLAVFAHVVTRLGNRYPIILAYPCNFPNRIPSVWPLEELRPKSPVHQYSDGRLCLTGNEYDGTTTGNVVLGWTYAWLNCYDIWKKTGKFPNTNYGRHRV